MYKLDMYIASLTPPGKTHLKEIGFALISFANENEVMDYTKYISVKSNGFRTIPACHFERSREI